MIKFTVELEDKTLTVMADSVEIEGETINFYRDEKIPLNGPSPLVMITKNIVGSFNNYKNFYIDGGNDD